MLKYTLIVLTCVPTQHPTVCVNACQKTSVHIWNRVPLNIEQLLCSAPLAFPSPITESSKAVAGVLLPTILVHTRPLHFSLNIQVNRQPL